MKTIFKNLLESKISKVVELIEIDSVSLNEQIYSKSDNEYILYTNKPIFGSIEPVYIRNEGSRSMGLYNEEEDTIIYTSGYEACFFDSVYTSTISMVDNLDVILFSEALDIWLEAESKYQHTYKNLDRLSYFSIYRCKSKIDTTQSRFGLPYIDEDDLPF